jgi:hypothetical protein
VPGSGGGGDCPPQSVPSEDARPKKSLHTVPSSASLYGTDIVVEEHRLLVESIARHIVYGESLCSSGGGAQAARGEHWGLQRGESLYGRVVFLLQMAGGI